MTIETERQSIPEPQGYGFNTKPPDMMEIVFCWLDGMQFFSLGAMPDIKVVTRRVVGHKTKTKFRVDLVTSALVDEPVPYMSPEQLAEIGAAIGGYITTATGLKCDKINPALIDHG